MNKKKNVFNNIYKMKKITIIIMNVYKSKYIQV